MLPSSLPIARRSCHARIRPLGPLCVAIAFGTFGTLANVQRAPFRLEEATIADVHRAIQARQLTATQLVEEYLKRIAAHNGTCVNGAVDPATGFQLGDIEPKEH